jgi:hypothetical protein
MLPMTRAALPAAWSMVKSCSVPQPMFALQLHETFNRAVACNDERNECSDATVTLLGSLLCVHISPLCVRVSPLQRGALCSPSSAERIVEISLAVLFDACQPVHAAGSIISGSRVNYAARKGRRGLRGECVRCVDAPPRMPE